MYLRLRLMQRLGLLGPLLRAQRSLDEQLIEPRRRAPRPGTARAGSATQ